MLYMCFSMCTKEGAMLARRMKPTVKDYVSDRVFDGTRPISAARFAKLKANYKKTHTADRFVARMARIFRFKPAI